MCAEPETMRISVCTPTYQGLERLRRTVPVVLADLGDDDEAIYSVDGSDDGSVEYLEAIAAGDPRVRVLAHERNGGRTVALNAACRAARGRIVLRLDDDILVPAGFFDAHAEAHHGDDTPVGVVQPIVDVIDGEARHSMWRAFVERNAARDFERFRTSSSAPACLWGPVCSCDREVGERLGWYDERFSAYGWEDVEFGHRLSVEGVRLLVLGNTRVEHLVHWQRFRQKLMRGFEAGARMSVFAQLHGPEAVLQALGVVAAQRQPPSRALSGRALAWRRAGLLRGAGVLAASFGERLLGLLGWRRAYDWWVARWLHWSYACGWSDEAAAGGLPVIEVPTAWATRTGAGMRDHWNAAVGAAGAMGSPVGAVAILRSALLRLVEQETVPPRLVWWHALGTVRRLVSAAKARGGRLGVADEGAGIVLFEDATPSATDRLLRAMEALEADGHRLVPVASARYVGDFVRARSGRACVALDDILPRLGGGLVGGATQWRDASGEVARLLAAVCGSRLRLGEHVQLTAEAALASVLHRRASSAESLSAAPFVMAASEYFSTGVAMARAAHGSGVRWITLQHGAVNCMYAPFIADSYLVWSSAAADALRRLQPDTGQLVAVVGSPLQTVRPPNEDASNALRAEAGLSSGPVVCVFSQTHGPEFSAATHFGFASQLHLLLESVPEVQVLLKRHPSESRSAYEDLLRVHERCVLAPAAFSAVEAASISDIAVALGSTALVDATIACCATVEVLCGESLMEQAVSDIQVPLREVSTTLARLVTDAAEREAVVRRQWSGREMLIGPPGFAQRLSAAVGDVEGVAELA